VLTEQAAPVSSVCVCVMIQSQLKIKEVQVKSLETQAAKLRDVDPEKEQMLSSRKIEVEEKFNRLLAPLVERRQKLDQFKRVQQVCTLLYTSDGTFSFHGACITEMVNCLECA